MGKLLDSFAVDLRDAGSAAIKVAYPGREKQMKIRHAVIGEAAGTEKQGYFFGQLGGNGVLSMQVFCAFSNTGLLSRQRFPCGRAAERSR